MLKKELATAIRDRNPDEAALLVKSATIDLEVTTEFDVNAEGGVTFCVVELKSGASRTKGFTHRLSLELVPEEEISLGDGRARTSRLDA